MNSYQILRKIHKVGHPISGTVVGYKQPLNIHGMLVGANVILETSSKYKTILGFDDLFDEQTAFDERLFPPLGKEIETVILNHSDDTLYVSARPHLLSKGSMESYQQYYAYIDTLKEGQIVNGVVEKVMPFGLFVNIGSPFIGLIDIGHIDFNRGKQLSYDQSDWPKKGDSINCVVAYYRFGDKQIGLGWVPLGNRKKYNRD